VVGDLHGQRAGLEALLQRVGFQIERDRLFAVGDLIDRGPDSAGVLALLEQPWFYSARGNHEQLLIWGLHDPDQYQLWCHNGGDWIGRQPRARWVDWAERLDQLPHLWVVGEGERRFHVLHADLTLGGAMADGMPRVALDQDIDAALAGGGSELDVANLMWSRRLMTAAAHAQASGSPLPLWADGLSRSFCGHTPSRQIRQALSHICVDSGGFIPYLNPEYRDQGFGLTLMQADSLEPWFLPL